MSEKNQSEPSQPQLESYSMADFLESIPPNQTVHIKTLSEREMRNDIWMDVLTLPELQLHCPEDTCNGTRFFRSIGGKTMWFRVLSENYSNHFLKYRCWNCQKYERVFSIAARKNSKDDSGEAYKFGEFPPFGPPTPSRLIKLIGPDRETFLKGRRCENQGLGIGAFIYYRRVVENQKDRILSEIKKVAERVGASEKAIRALEAAMSETSFSKALEVARGGIPESLLIGGHNPMLLLHSALSEGVHERSDEECLEIASSVRVVLGELSDRLAQALKDEAELRHALSTLMNKKDGNHSPQRPEQ